jgi:hypothetical protein
MNFISRLIVLLVMSISLTTPAAAAVAVDVDGYCGAISADDVKKPDDKKTGGDKQPKEGDEEPECE